MSRLVVIVGAGITGLAAAHHLASMTTDDVAITVLEAADQLGGKIRTSAFAGRSAVDEGPDAFLVRTPFAIDLARSVGLADRIVAPTGASAAIWFEKLRPIPDGVLLGVPTSLMAVARSGLLSPIGMARAGVDLVRPRSSTEHDSIGRWVRERFGAQVHDRLVDALVGSIYGADTDRFSLAAVPQLASLVAQGRSALVSGRAMRSAATSVDGPIFGAPVGGLGELVTAIADHIDRHHGDRVSIRTNHPVTCVASDGQRWWVDDTAVDAVILAVPSHDAASMVGGALGSELQKMEAADVAMVTLAVPASTWPAHAKGRSGYLVPKSQQRLVTAVSFASQKWAHLDDGNSVVLRVSLGRDGLGVLHLDDETLIAAASEEVGRHLGVDLAPTASRLTRWPRAFTQYRPHHHRLVDHLDTLTGDGLALAGASYRGIGIPACVADGRRAAERVASHLKD